MKSVAILEYPAAPAHDPEAEDFSIFDLEDQLGLSMAIIRPRCRPEIGVLIWTRGPNTCTLTQAEFISAEFLSRPYPVVCLCGVCHLKCPPQPDCSPDDFFQAVLQRIDRHCAEARIRWLIVHRRPPNFHSWTKFIEGLHKEQLCLALAEAGGFENQFPIIISQRNK
jgi:hypothetical protein